MRQDNGLERATSQTHKLSTRQAQANVSRSASKHQNGYHSQSLPTSEQQPDDGQTHQRPPSGGYYPRSESRESEVSREDGSETLFRNGKSIRRVGSQEGVLPLDDEDWNSRWIHRDKLAMIEIQEMQEAGVPIPFHKYLNGNSVRNSNAQATPATLRNRNASDPRDRDWQREETRTPDDLIYSSQSQDEEELAVLPDPRTPEEIAADPYERGLSIPLAHAHGLRASSSRIPLSTSSLAPIPIEHIERNTPLPRKRGTSANWNGESEDPLASNKTRRRSRSVGSMTMFDDGASIGNTSPQAHRNRQSGNHMPSPRLSSNPKAPGQSTPRNTSGHKREASGGQKSRTPSAALRGSPAQRPATRSGLATRPATAVNRPEGEAPWIASMFKPDPMLPPEQQLLPTYAKRLQQEQWEKEGRSGAAFDKNFNPIAIQQDRDRPAPSSQEEIPPPKSEGERGRDAPEVPTSWPLTSPQESNSPKTPTSEHAGYRTIPRVHSTPSITGAQSPRLQPPRTHSNIQKPLELEPLKMEDNKKERGCGCCIVM